MGDRLNRQSYDPMMGATGGGGGNLTPSYMNPYGLTPQGGGYGNTPMRTAGEGNGGWMPAMSTAGGGGSTWGQPMGGGTQTPNYDAMIRSAGGINNLSEAYGGNLPPGLSQYANMIGGGTGTPQSPGGGFGQMGTGGFWNNPGAMFSNPYSNPLQSIMSRYNNAMGSGLNRMVNPNVQSWQGTSLAGQPTGGAGGGGPIRNTANNLGNMADLYNRSPAAQNLTPQQLLTVSQGYRPTQNFLAEVIGGNLSPTSVMNKIPFLRR